MNYNKHFPDSRPSQPKEDPFLLPIRTDRTLTHYSNKQIKLKVPLSDQERTIKELQNKVFSLEQLIKQQQKEISQLKQLNQYLQLANKSKLDLINQERHVQLKIPESQADLKQQSKLKSISVYSFSTVLTTLKNKPQPSPTKKDQSSNPPSRRQSIKSQHRLSFQYNEADIEKAQNLNQENANKIHQNLLNFLQVEECFRINAILSLNQSNNVRKDGEAIGLYENDGTLMFMDQILKDEEIFMDVIQHSGPQKLSFLYDKLKRILTDHRSLFIINVKQNCISFNEGAVQMSQTTLIDDCLKTIMEQIIQCLECDRATCFVVDSEKNELWSKIAKGTQRVLRVPIGKGIAGYVAQKKEMVNITNAYLDQRFHQEIDAITNYRTKTILACPIQDNDRCLGVLQCINKVEGTFTKEDEALLLILAEFSRIVLNNAFSNDEQLIIRNKLRHTINTGLMLGQTVDDLKGLQICSQDRLKAMMNVEHARIGILSKDKRTIMHINDNGEIKNCEWDTGIMGEAIKSNSVISIFNCYTHPQFNPKIDLSCQMPVLIIPLKNYETEEIIGGLEVCFVFSIQYQVVNLKSIGTLYQSTQPLINSLDMEILDYFMRQLAQFIIVNEKLVRQFEKKQTEKFLSDQQ